MPLLSGLSSTTGPLPLIIFEGLELFHPALMELEGSNKHRGGQASRAQAGFDLEPVGWLG